MQFNETTNETGLVQYVNSLLGVSDTDYPLKDKARNSNLWLEEASFILLTSSGTWQFDDSNHTTVPEGTTDLVSGQRNYTLNQDYYRVTKVLVKDQNGEWAVIDQIDQYEEGVRQYLENNSGNVGTPTRYDLRGSELILDPIPNYNYSGGLKVYFQRPPSYFVHTDTTKEPGIPSIFHRYVALGCAYEFAYAKSMNQTNNIKNEMMLLEEKMRKHGSKRNPDKPLRMIPQGRSINRMRGI